MPQRDDMELAKFEEHSDYAMRTIETEHAWIHKGNGFVAGNLNLAVANNASVEILVESANSMHALVQVAGGGDLIVRFFEDTTKTVGTPLTVFNKNRYSSIVSGAAISHTPTGSGDGTEFPPALVAGGSGGNAQGGQSDSFGREWILNGTKKYLMRITNISGVSVAISANLEWYEPEAVAP